MAFDQAKADSVLEQIAEGKSIRQTGTSTATVWRWAESNPTFASQYARAMEQRADVHAERIEQTAAELLDGTRTDAQAARTAIDALKWTASKLRPKRYGDRVQVDADMTLRVTVEDPTARAVATILPKPALPHDGE